MCSINGHVTIRQRSSWVNSSHHSSSAVLSLVYQQQMDDGIYIFDLNNPTSKISRLQTLDNTPGPPKEIDNLKFNRLNAMQANIMIGVIVTALIVFMVLLGVGIHYFVRARNRCRYPRSQELGQSSTCGTEGTSSMFSTQSNSTRSSAQGSDRRYRTYQDSSSRLSDIAEEQSYNGEFQEVSPAASSKGPTEFLTKLEQETPASHGCNQTCHGHSPKPGERRVGLGIAHGKGCLYSNEV
ncbi:hypothetical protein NHQ30_004875 [Ciborinia camelliae]|nr:hypothetical protein NHQ30_004875 [Ciborinia camelliae]